MKKISQLIIYVYFLKCESDFVPLDATLYQLLLPKKLPQHLAPEGSNEHFLVSGFGGQELRSS